MLKTAYKYDPTDFNGILGLSEDLTTFYKLHEEYSRDRTQSKLFALENHWENLFFTIKHRALEGAITETTARELRGYLEELMNDD